MWAGPETVAEQVVARLSVAPTLTFRIGRAVTHVDGRRLGDNQTVVASIATIRSGIPRIGRDNNGPILRGWLTPGS